MPRGCMGIGDRSPPLDDRPRRHRLPPRARVGVRIAINRESPLRA